MIMVRLTKRCHSFQNRAFIVPVADIELSVLSFQVRPVLRLTKRYDSFQNRAFIVPLADIELSVMFSMIILNLSAFLVQKMALDSSFPMK
jgi:hypothetical protein